MFVDKMEKVLKPGEMPTKGIIHIGCGFGEDISYYQHLGLFNALWIDANPDAITKAYDHIKNFHGMTNRFSSDFLSNFSGESVSFLIKNRELKSGLEGVVHEQDIRKKVLLNTLTFENFYKQNMSSVNLDDYDFVRVSTNGTELKVLEGFGNLYNIFDFKVICISRDYSFLSSSFNKTVDEKALQTFLGLKGYEQKGRVVGGLQQTNVDIYYGKKL